MDQPHWNTFFHITAPFRAFTTFRGEAVEVYADEKSFVIARDGMCRYIPIFRLFEPPIEQEILDLYWKHAADPLEHLARLEEK